MTSQPKPLDPGEMTQEQLVLLSELLLGQMKHQHRPGSYEREAYEGSLGLLGMFPHQPWWKRIWGRGRKRRAEKAMQTLRLVAGEDEK